MLYAVCVYRVLTHEEIWFLKAMFPVFDGQYRSKPQVSLRGASKQVGTICVCIIYVHVKSHYCIVYARSLLQEQKGKLLQRAHNEREKREVCCVHTF